MDLGKTDAEWLRLLGSEIGGMILAPARVLFETRDRFKEARTQVQIDGNAAHSTVFDIDAGAGLILAGANIGTNTAADGRLWCRITGSGPYTVSLYTAAGASGLVAQGAANAGAVATLTAQNSSGLTGTADLHASIAADATDTIQILVVQDWRARLATVFNETDGVTDDPYTRQVLAAAYAATARRIDAALGDFLSYVPAALLAAADNPIARVNEFTGAGDSTLASVSVDNDGSAGGVTVSRSGAFETLKLAMADETTGSTQGVLRRLPASVTTTFGSANAGTYSVPTHTPGDRTPAQTVVFKCTRGVDTGDLGNEAFQARITQTEGEERIYTASELAVIGQPWSNANGIGPITISRTYTKTGDGSDLNFAAASGAVVSGENNSNTDEGTLYWSTTTDTTNTIKFFSSSSLDASTLVAQADSIATSTAFTATQKNGSGLTVNWTTGGTLSSTNGSLLLNPPKVDADGNGTPDQFTVAITVPAAAGIYQTLMSRVFGAELNGVASSETISDSYATQSTFAPFVVRDN